MSMCLYLIIFSHEKARIKSLRMTIHEMLLYIQDYIHLQPFRTDELLVVFKGSVKVIVTLNILVRQIGLQNLKRNFRCHLLQSTMLSEILWLMYLIPSLILSVYQMSTNLYRTSLIQLTFFILFFDVKLSSPRRIL